MFLSAFAPSNKEAYLGVLPATGCDARHAPCAGSMSGPPLPASDPLLARLR